MRENWRKIRLLFQELPSAIGLPIGIFVGFRKTMATLLHMSSRLFLSGQPLCLEPANAKDSAEYVSDQGWAIYCNWHLQ